MPDAPLPRVESAIAGQGGRPRFRLARQSDARIALICFFFVFCVGFVARLYDIASMPFWLDEVTTVQRASLPFWDMVADSLANHHLPSYFALAALFGSHGMTEAALRFPSAVFGALSCGVLFLIGRVLGGRPAGLVAGLLLALSPLQVQYGQEARSYTFVVLMMAIGLLGFVQLAQDSRSASLPWNDPHARLRPWVVYTLGTLGGLNVLSTAFFWLISANIGAVAILLLGRGFDRRRFLLRWLATLGVIALFTLPWFVAMDYFTHGKMTDATNWVPQITWDSFFSVVDSLYFLRVSRLISFHVFPAAIPGFGLLVLILGVLGLIHLRRGLRAGRRPRGLITALVIAAAAPPLLILLISIVKPLWMPRYLLWSTVPFLVFVGLGINVVPRRWRDGALAALGLLALVNLLPYYHAETKPRWDLAALALVHEMHPGDLILASDELPVYMMNFFLQRHDTAIPASDWTTDVFRAARHLQDGGRVWVMFGRVGQADRTPIANFVRIIKPLGKPVAEVHVGQLIRMKLYAGQPHPVHGPAAAGVFASDCDEHVTDHKQARGAHIPASCYSLALQ
jgi:hypothetical protein